VIVSEYAVINYHLVLCLCFIAPSASAWATINDPKQLTRVYMHSNLGEIYDLEWSAESDFLVAGSIDTKVC